MATAKKTRIKAKAQIYVPQTKDEAASEIRSIGDLQRQVLRIQSEMNDAIGEITEKYQPMLEALSLTVKSAQEGVQAYCEAHRNELTHDGKVKTANFVTGDVQWRCAPPSVKITGAEAVIEALKRLGLGKFVRTKEEINKEAILNEPDEVKGVAGIKVVKDVEDFVITPFEQEAA